MGGEPRPWNALRSAYHAVSGLLWVAPRTPSLKLGIVAAVGMVVLGAALRFSLAEIALLVLAGTTLLAVETLNTAVEMLCDHVEPGDHPSIGKVKDVAAGATVFCEIGGAVVLLLVLGSHVLSWLGR
ncbi:MAG: diacylglycerol kinase [Candidatus Dormibacterales bacterium]